MVRLAWWMVTVALALVLPHAEAQATCGVDCELTPMLESCEVPAVVDCTDCDTAGAYEWKVLNRVMFTAVCSEECCSEAGCAPLRPAEIDLGYFRVSDAVTGDSIELTSTLEETCGELVVMDVQLVAGRTYHVVDQFIIRFTLAVAEDAVEVEGEDDTGTGDTGNGDTGNTGNGDADAGDTATGDTSAANMVEGDTGCRQARPPGPWGLGALLLGLGLTAMARVRRRA